jgi:hypothetical protein
MEQASGRSRVIPTMDGDNAFEDTLDKDLHLTLLETCTSHLDQHLTPRSATNLAELPLTSDVSLGTSAQSIGTYVVDTYIDSYTDIETAPGKYQRRESEFLTNIRQAPSDSISSHHDHHDPPLRPQKARHHIRRV